MPKQNSVGPRQVAVKFRVDREALARIDARQAAAGYSTRAAYLAACLADCALADRQIELTEIARSIGRLGHLCNQLLTPREATALDLSLSTYEAHGLVRKITRTCDAVTKTLKGRG